MYLYLTINNNDMKSTKNTIATRTATIADFKTGVTLIDAGGSKHVIADKYDNGIWNTKSCNVVFEGNAKFYTVAL